MVFTLGPDEVIEDIFAVRAKMNAADEDRDLETYLRHCTDEVVAMPPGRPPVQGIEGLREFLIDVHEGDETDERTFEYRTHSLVVRGNQAFDHGTLELRTGESGSGESTVRELKYVDSYKQEPDDTWKMDTAAWFAPE